MRKHDPIEGSYDELVWKDGETYKIQEWTDGSWRFTGGDDSRGYARIAKRAPDWKNIQTSEQGKAVRRAGIEKQQEAALRGAMQSLEKSGKIGMGTREDIVAAVFESQTDLAMSPEMGRSSTEAGKFVLSGVGAHVDMRGEKEGAMQAVQVNINISEEVGNRVEDLGFNVIDA